MAPRPRPRATSRPRSPQRPQATETDLLEPADGACLTSQYLDIVNHEFRTPLNFIVGFGSLLADGVYGELPPAAREAVERILEGADRLAGLVEDLLEQSRIANGHLRLDICQTDCRELVSGVAAEFQTQAKAKGVELTWAVAAGTPALQTDPLRLHQALRHLVGNAVKFTPGGGTVRLEAHPTARGVSLTVTDTGIGIPEPCCRRIFERFYQVDASTTRRHGGVGLGLAIVKGIVDSLGGAIRVESQPGHGARFTLELPTRVG